MSTKKLLRIVILGSTRGTLLDAIMTSPFASDVVGVVTNKANAGIVEMSEKWGIDCYFLRSEKDQSRDQYDARLLRLVQSFDPNIILLIGWMKILSTTFIQPWLDTSKFLFVNVHPSLLPAFGGKCDLQVHEAVLNSGHSQTGCSVHRVTEELDGGEILKQKICAVKPEDTKESLKKRVQELEGTALVEVISDFQSSLHFDGNSIV